MTQRIVYKNNDGSISIVVPAPDTGLTIQQIAAKDVPHGIPYEIVSVEDIPEDRTFRNAWTLE